jgi:putative heme degradation protein
MSSEFPARSTRPASATPFSGVPNPEESASCRCCEARSRALDLALWDSATEWNSPLTPGILPGNIAIGEIENSVRIDLWRDWPRMLTSLQRIGPVLSMTRNATAAIGSWGPFPELEWSDGRATDDDGDFDFDLRHWARAFSRHQRGIAGHLFSAEIHDYDGICFHRVCLTGGSSLDAFSEWTRVHQAVGHAVIPPPPDEAPARDSALTEGSRIVPGTVIADFLRECIERELPVRAIVGSSGAVQGHRFIPRKVSESDGWTYCHSEEIALHYLPESIAEVRLHDLAPGGAPCWTLRAYDSSGALVLMLLPATSERLPMWNFLASHIA